MWIWSKKGNKREESRIKEAEQAKNDVEEQEEQLRPELEELYRTHQLNGITAHIVKSLRPRNANS